MPPAHGESPAMPLGGQQCLVSSVPRASKLRAHAASAAAQGALVLALLPRPASFFFLEVGELPRYPCRACLPSLAVPRQALLDKSPSQSYMNSPQASLMKLQVGEHIIARPQNYYRLIVLPCLRAAVSRPVSPLAEQMAAVVQETRS